MYVCVYIYVVFIFEPHKCCLVNDSFATTWTAAYQAPVSTGFPRQEYWNGCQFLPQAIFPTPLGSNPHLLHQQADSLPLSHQGSLQLFK